MFATMQKFSDAQLKSVRETMDLIEKYCEFSPTPARSKKKSDPSPSTSQNKKD